MSTTTWVHVSRSRPCPVCGRPDWCLVTADEAACICPRTESPRWVGEAGYLYRLADGGNRVRRVVVEHRLVPTAQIGEFAERCHRSVAPGRLGGLADSLGLSAASLTALRVGWSA
ncbi:MAG TPA: hypothetical protein VKE74_16525, partial [Gemmataceae bacterium]|nr:hypothetical protein [Gemmataceae bacterium]